MGTKVHKIETPKPERYNAHPLVADGTVITNAVVQEFVVACAGVKTVYLRGKTTTATGALAARGRRTNEDEYPVGFTVADTAVAAGTAFEVAVPCKGMKEIIVRMTPTLTGSWDYLDVGFEAP